MTRFFYTSAILSMAVLLSPITAKADTPVLSSFSVSPQAISHGQPLNISWTTIGGAGASLNFACPPGVTIKRPDGNSFGCNYQTPVSSSESDGISVIVYNNSGTVKQIPITIRIKDTGGNFVDSTTQVQTMSVNPNPYPITSFTVATSTPENTQTTVSWVSASDVPGVNLSVTCASSDITFSVPSIGSQKINCGTPVSSTDLPANGSLAIVFYNASPVDISVPIRVMPSISSGSYDAINAVQKNILVLGHKTIIPVVTSASANPAQIPSSGTSTISWTASNTIGVNVKFDCNEYLSFGLVNGTTSTPIICGNYFFSQPSTASSTVVQITNSRYYGGIATASVIPAYPDNTYNGLNGKTVTLAIGALGNTSLPSNITAPVTVAQTPATAITTTTTINKFTFTKAMTRGTAGNEVRELQKFFAKYPAIYGAVTVNGTYGPATEKLVMKFQEKYGVAKKGGSGYGSVGPATRKKLNEIQ